MIGTVEELRRYLHTTGGGGAADDALLGDLLAAASDRLTSLVPDRTLEARPAGDDPAADPDLEDPVARTIRMDGYIARLPDLRRAESVVIDGTPLAAADYDLDGRDNDGTFLYLRLVNATAYPTALVPAPGWTLSTTRRRLVVTGWWGPAQPWPRVKEAVLVWAARVYHERAARFSDARQDPDGGVSSYFRRVPPGIESVVNDLRVPGL